jgi:signal transduction histidine kinase
VPREPDQLTPSRRRPTLLMAGAGLALLAVSLPWIGADLDAGGLTLVVLAAVAVLTLGDRTEGRTVELVGPVAGAALVAGVIATTGGPESPYQDLLMAVPVSAGALGGRRSFVLACAAVVAAAFSPGLYASLDRAYVLDQLVDLPIWISVATVVHVQTRAYRRQAARLRQHDELKDAFLQATSHELRTPLTVIRGLAATLRARDEELDGAQRELLLERLDLNAGRLSDLLADLLDLDRLQRDASVLDEAERDLALVVAGVLNHLGPHHHVVHTELVPVEVRLDVRKVERIVENLITNALRHTPSGTNIWLRTQLRRGCAELVIEDDGPGIPDPEKLSVFRPFEQGSATTRSPNPGTGIGLALVSSFAHLHGASVEVSDRPSGGTRFTLTFPAGRTLAVAEGSVPTG